MIRIMCRHITVLILLFSLPATADRTLVWDKFPITLVLPVGDEVRVTFPVDVTLQLPIGITDKLESLAPNQRIVYWKATAPFDSVRAIATSADNESVYLIDLVAQDGAAIESVRIEDPDRIIAQSTPSLEGEHISGNVQELVDPPEILLTRFASQSLYAPRRLVPVNANISLQPISGLPSAFPLMRSQSGEQYQFSIVGAWAGYGRFITAVMAVNKSPITVHIHPGLISGNFSHITAQHLTLGPSGSLEDRTTVYLISDTPFASAILEDGYGY